MALKKQAKVVAAHRERFVGLRITESDAAELERLAAGESVGISTMARLVIEQYVARFGRKGRG